MVIHGKTNFVLAPMLYLLDCHWRPNIRPSHPYVSPHTLLGPIDAPHRTLGAHKKFCGKEENNREV